MANSFDLYRAVGRRSWSKLRLSLPLTLWLLSPNAPASADGPLRVAVPFLPTTLSDLTHPVARVLIENSAYSLTKANASGGVSLQLASSLTSSSEMKRWTATLKEGLQFSSGRPLTPASCVESLRSAIRVFSTPGSKNIHSIQAISQDSTLKVEFTLKAGDPAFPELLATLPLTDPELQQTFGEEGWSGNFIAGTGPFTFQASDEDSVRLIPTAGFLLPALPAATALEFRVYPSSNAALSALRLGSADLILIPTTNQLKLAADDRTLEIIDSPLAKMTPRLQSPARFWPATGKVRDTLPGESASKNVASTSSAETSSAGTLADSTAPDLGEELQLAKFIVRKTLKLDSEALARLDLRGSCLP